jgi:hypothetical protein
VLLMECGTHAICDAEITSVKQGELGRVLSLLSRQATPDLLLLCDAGLCWSRVMITARNQGAHLLGRLARCRASRPWRRLPDGR